MRPTSGPARPYAFPSVERFQTSAGIRVAVAPIARVPLVTIHVIVDGGAAIERASFAGVAHLTARGLAEGTQHLTGEALAEQFERLGSGLEPGADWESIEIQSTVLASHFERAFALIAELVMQPAFRDGDIARLREERLAELLQRDAEPRELADDELAISIFANGERLQLPIAGEHVTVQRVDRKVIADWHAATFSPSRLSVIVVGDVAPERVREVLERFLGGWRPSSVPNGAPQTARLSDDVGVRLVTLEQAVQSEVRIGHAGPPRSHPDYYALVVMNAILGGLFGSRINLNLRERHGYTYGASSAFLWRRDGSVFATSTAVATEATVPAIREVRSEIERIREQLILPSELDLAVEHLEGIFPLRFETTETIANALAVQHVFGLPVSYFDEYRARIRSVMASDVLRVAQAHLSPSALQIVVVGSDQLQHALDDLAEGRARVRSGHAEVQEPPDE